MNPKSTTTTSRGAVGQPASGPAAEGFPKETPLAAKVASLVSRKQYDDAAKLLRTAPRSTWTSNTLGVCLMRSGQIDEALKVYRALLLMPGTTQLRPEADDLCRINFATALMLHGLPSGALEVLNELQSPQLPAAELIRAAIEKWSRTLPLWRRLDWKFNRIDPRGTHVPIDFEPGEFAFLARRKDERPPLHPAHPDLAA